MTEFIANVITGERRMSKQLIKGAALLVLMLFGMNLSAQTGSSLDGISYSALPGDRPNP